MNRHGTEDFQGSEATLYDTLMVDACHYTFVQTPRMHTTMSEPYSELWTMGDNDVSV